MLATPAPTSHRTAEENLGLGYLAAVLRHAHHRVEILDGWLEGLSPGELATRITQVPHTLWIGFACYRSNMEKALDTLVHLREAGVTAPIVAGGYGPTFFADQFLRGGFDIVVRGEGEVVALALTEHLLHGKPALDEIPGLVLWRDETCLDTGPPQQVADLDELPWPARDTLPLVLARRSAVHVVSSRGCRAHCLFCSIVSFARLSHGPNWRQRSIEALVDELESLVERGATTFKIVDDSLIEPPRDAAWCWSLADELQRRGLDVRLRGSLRADRIDREILAGLKAAGFYAFSCGIESFSRTALARMAKTANLDDNFAALDLLKEQELLVQAGHILFDDQTTMLELHENLAGMRRYPWTISKGIFTEMFAAEGTPYTKLLQRRGRLASNGARLENHTYELINERVAVAYDALKHWHKAHMRLYDKAIDAISAPKAVDDASLRRFHRLSTRLRALDIETFGLVLGLVDAGEPRATVMEWIADRIREQDSLYAALAAEVDAVYRDAGLVYDATENPFVS